MSEPIEKEELLERVDNDMEFLEETIGMFQEDYPALLEEIQTGLATGDSEAVYRAAHTLKGAISNFCAPRAEEAALRVEQSAKDGDLSTGEDQMRTLQEEIERMVLVLKQILQENAS